MEEKKNYIQIDKKLIIFYSYVDPETFVVDPNKIFIMVNNKYIPIPEELRKQIVTDWQISKSEEIVSETNEKCKTCRKEGKMLDYTLADTVFQLVLCLIIIVALLYSLSLIRRSVI